MRMQGFGPGLCFTGGCTKTVQQWNADFTAALLALLGPRFAGIVRVEIIDGPQQCPPPPRPKWARPPPHPPLIGPPPPPPPH